MKLNFSKDHKYYNIQNQLTLFGNESLICSWESVNSNRRNHKIVECNTLGEIHSNLNRIVKVRKKRGYNITLTSASKTETNLTTIHNIERLALLLDKPEQFKIIQKYRKPEFYKIDDSVPKQIGVFLDTETTGLSYKTDKIIELGMVKFEYCKNGYIYKILEEFNGYQDPNEPIVAHVQELTGITDEMVKGKNIDQNIVAEFLEDVDVIVAHNAAFDRPFFKKLFSDLSAKAWGCSRTDID